MAKLPSFQFYPGDWLRDNISGCSLAAQGLWLRMMFVMHDSERYGYLQLNGSPMDPETIARRCGCALDEYTALLCELSRAGILSQSINGTIFSRRMVRDAKEREKNRSYVKKSRERKGEKKECKGDVRFLKGDCKSPLHLHSSSSSSEIQDAREKISENEMPPEPKDRLDTPTGADETDLAEDEMPILYTFFDYLGNRNQRKQVRSKTITAIIDKRHQGTAWMLAAIAWAAQHPKKYSYLSFLLNDYEKADRQASQPAKPARPEPTQTASLVSGREYQVQKQREFEERCQKQKEAGLIK
jgi:hypothetical protein